MSNPAPGQLSNLSNSHRPSTMTAHQVQDYIDLLCSKAPIVGEHYLARQMAWAVVELERVQCVDIGEAEGDPRCWYCCGTGEIDSERCDHCGGTGFDPEDFQEDA